MLRIKRLYSFILQSFIPVFAMTFGICLFIVLMQFLWKYVEDLVGKGLDNLVLAELFFYAALSLIPLALPLSILLASLMAFGNLGERLELLAIKAAGVSLLKAMKPLIIFMIFVSVGAFFFQNEAMPRINIKFRTLLVSIRQKSPELDIPEGSFYNGIENFSIYVKKKNPETGILYEVMIYDTQTFNDMSVFVCDSAKMQVSEDKMFLVLNLLDGQRFANFKEAEITNKNTVRGRNNQFVPYSRENFKRKEIIIPFDANFSRMDEAEMEGSQMAKNLNSLNTAIDSMNVNIDSLNKSDRMLMQRIYIDNNYKQPGDTIPKVRETTTIDLDSITTAMSRSEMIRIMSTAVSQAESNGSTFIFQSWTKTELQKKIRQHEVEWHRKFTLSFACIVFFFIGAPLGAIIRKGGMGMPVVISVILFIIYYIFDNVGVKMARDGVWEAWQGMWLSSIILFPLGVFLTYKAMNDSALFNVEAYGKFIRKILRIDTKVNEEDSAADIERIPLLTDLDADKGMVEGLKAMPNEKLRSILVNHEENGYDRNIIIVVLSILKERGDTFDGVKISVGNQPLAKHIFGEFKKNTKWAILTYFVALAIYIIYSIINSEIIWWLFSISFIAYIGMYIKSVVQHSDFYKALKIKLNARQILTSVVGLLCYPLLDYLLRRDMTKNTKGKI